MGSTGKYLQFDSGEVAIDREGFLKDLSDWNAEVAVALAQQESISLGPSHWEILNLLRVFYQRHQMSLASRALVSLVRRELGADKGTSIHLMKLFQGSAAKMANKIAGLPKPDNCL
ncbi:MAG: TusE/DsrC/DsvC family sulfur relay protein [Proteobacteria bacterium]|nr:TusE/DsrC/DsvC family sulfur relay protein [Pseudomonadota bacterium]